MARITVEDCINFYPNRFELVLIASRRGRLLLRGGDTLTPSARVKAHKPAVQALKELGEGLVSWESLLLSEQIERNRIQAAPTSRDEEDESF